MGVNITDLLIKKEIELKQLRGKIIAVDASLFLYQFLTTIRGRDGALLTDSKGNVTSHLVGLFSRTTNLMNRGLKLVYVFDGKPPELKNKEKERRIGIKKEAELKYKKAKEKEDIEEMRKYAARTSRLTPEMVEEAKKLLIVLGLPIVQAPSEGEAQAAYIVKNKDAFAVASQDADSLLFGADNLVRNLSMVGKRKRTNKLIYKTIKPEIVDLAENLNNLGIDQEQLIVLCMLVGTDYNLGGIKGIGPKNAIKIVKKHKSDIDALFSEVKWKENFDFSWQEVFYTFKKIPVTKNYNLKWKGVDEAEVKKILVDDHDFSEERVDSSLKKLLEERKSKQQKGLGEWFK